MKQRLASVVVGGIILLIGLLFFWEGIPHTHLLTCQRVAAKKVDCQRQEIIFWWIPIKTVSLKNLQAVRMGQGKNAYDSTVYFISFEAEGRKVMFGNSLYLEEVQKDLLKAQQFLQNGKTQSLTLKRYEAQYFFALIGLLLTILGFQITIWQDKSKYKSFKL